MLLSSMEEVPTNINVPLQNRNVPGFPVSHFASFLFINTLKLNSNERKQSIWMIHQSLRHRKQPFC